VVARSVAEAFDYHLFAKTYGWTPAQVEETADATLQEMALIIDEMAKEEDRRIKRASRK